MAPGADCPRVALAEHFQHAIGDAESADDVDGGGGDGDEAEDVARSAIVAAPARTSEPISEMPEMALVADISGVCSSGGTG